MYLVISCSLNAESRSRILGQRAHALMAEAGQEVEWIDLSGHSLVMCDGDTCYADPRVGAMAQRIRQSDGILLACPIYNYDVNAAAKNLVELTGRAWQEKVVGFLCAAGGRSSYMSVMGLANSLMLDFRCLIVPRFVYATGSSFEGGELTDPKIEERIVELTQSLVRISAALK